MTDPLAVTLPITGGALDVLECPKWRRNCWGRGRCACGRCRLCGHQKHAAIHGPLFGCPPGSPPYGHEFQPDMDLRRRSG